MRKVQAEKYGVCICGAAPFPHRRGYCANGAAAASMNRAAYGEPDETPGLAKTEPEDEALAFFDALASAREPR